MVPIISTYILCSIKSCGQANINVIEKCTPLMGEARGRNANHQTIYQSAFLRGEIFQGECETTNHLIYSLPPQLFLWCPRMNVERISLWLV